jgi:hypothetical protein
VALFSSWEGKSLVASGGVGECFEVGVDDVGPEFFECIQILSLSQGFQQLRGHGLGRSFGDHARKLVQPLLTFCGIQSRLERSHGFFTDLEFRWRPAFSRLCGFRVFRHGLKRALFDEDWIQIP